jgi:hypothetical protein
LDDKSKADRQELVERAQRSEQAGIDAGVKAMQARGRGDYQLARLWTELATFQLRNASLAKEAIRALDWLTREDEDSPF